MMKKLLIIAILLSAFSKGYSCSCHNEWSFDETFALSELTALVKVNQFLVYKDIYGSSVPMSMEVEIIEIFKGEESRKKIVVWGDNGFRCRPYLGVFNTDSYYIISFFQAGDTSSSDRFDYGERPTDYTISSCGEFWLNFDYKKQRVNGRITQKINRLDFREFKSTISYFIERSKIYTNIDFEEVFKLTAGIISRPEETKISFFIDKNLEHNYFIDYQENVFFEFIKVENEGEVNIAGKQIYLKEFIIEEDLIEIKFKSDKNYSKIFQFKFHRRNGKWNLLWMN